MTDSAQIDLTKIMSGSSVFNAHGQLVGTVSKDAEPEGVWVEVSGGTYVLFFPQQIASVDEDGSVRLKPIVDLSTLRVGAKVFNGRHDLVGTVSEVLADKAAIERQGKRSASFVASDIFKVDEAGNVYLSEEWTDWLANADSVEPRLDAYGTDSGTVIHVGSRSFDPDLEY